MTTTARQTDHRHRVLVVEDEIAIVDAISYALELEGFSVTSAVDGRSGLDAARRLKPSVVLLDVMLPGMSGLDVCRQLRRESDVPIIMLTAREGEADKVAGLELGADDYMTKPFSPKELVARVRAVLRRGEQAKTAGDVLLIGALALDLPRMRVTVGDQPVELTSTEFQLLAALARYPGRVYTRAQLLDALHGVAFESYERAIDAHIKNIRRKLEPDPRRPQFLLTVHGVGYKLADL